MRLKHVPEADGIIEASGFCIHDPKERRGQWNKSFSNDNPIHIEIGMGKGKFLLEMARQNPDINYIGIERYSSVMYKAVKAIEQDEEALGNVLFLCEDAGALPEFFEKGEIERIYLNFSDPWPKARHAKRRLTAPGFLERYERVLTAGGKLELKTDNVDLFDFSLETIGERAGWSIMAYTYDLREDVMLSLGNVPTEYEERFVSKGQRICKLIATYDE